MRRPGIEPGPRAWKARILTIELSTLLCNKNIFNYSASGIRTRVVWVKTIYPDQLD